MPEPRWSSWSSALLERSALVLLESHRSPTLEGKGSDVATEIWLGVTPLRQVALTAQRSCGRGNFPHPRGVCRDIRRRKVGQPILHPLRFAPTPACLVLRRCV